MNNRIQEIMDLEHFKTLTPIQDEGRTGTNPRTGVKS